MSRSDKQRYQEYRNRKLANHYKNYPVHQPSPLLEFLITNVTSGSRTKAKHLLSFKMVYVDKVITTQFDTPLKPGQIVQIAERGNQTELRSHWLKILYEDAFLLVIDKAPGILTNAPLGGRENSIKHILDEYLKRNHQSLTSHTVHRLDRFTSGVMIFAKRRDVQQKFMDFWHDIVTDRRYVAVVQGTPSPAQGTVSSWLKDSKTFMTYSSNYDNGGKYAVTHYRVMRTSPLYSLVEFKLETGRKNQIRVHMQDIQHPVVGDLKYGSDIDPVGRVCLHAYKIEFTHPITGEHMYFETPIPQQFTSLLE